MSPSPCHARFLPEKWDLAVRLAGHGQFMYMLIPYRKNNMQVQEQTETPGREIPLASRCLVLVGLMGAGKSTVGRRLGNALRLPFHDADQEIETAAGCSVSDFFERYGETAFRDGERKVIARLLGGPRHVLATGGGAFMDPTTRALIKKQGLSIWLRADITLLMERVSKRPTRPLLKNGDPKATMERLMEERYPTYAEADITVDSNGGPHDTVVQQILAQLAAMGIKTGT
jgi:shikimate kinase